MPFTPRFIDGSESEFTLGKIVCVGRNYADHAKELNNAVPDSPVVFIKPSTAAVELEEPIAAQFDHGEVHFETELALLIGKRMSNVTAEEATQGIVGAGLALDLTLRDVQSDLKKQGYPWERAKGFDGACPISRFVHVEGEDVDWQSINFHLDIDGKRQQTGDTSDMLFSVAAMIEDVSKTFTLEPGDILLTGTPAGVGALPRNAVLGMSLSLGLDVGTRTR
ncbi:fumarylacetoacetate hydrolase family protein [Salinicola rhizosphaerae]|uniref:Isomerase/hydrolase n=1 Tax=Salinicola rhizosphaerae TaxID=1443141 RepID=A0ABQ3EF38_9GAMM|nr:fumarylacetoacetate hydrolase family protein [Salinicola rhizosphaerae]GHB32762.1 isomerase/hydrolase [Salinicola rhizosphaerae]